MLASLIWFGTNVCLLIICICSYFSHYHGDIHRPTKLETYFSVAIGMYWANADCSFENNLYFHIQFFSSRFQSIGFAPFLLLLYVIFRRKKQRSNNQPMSKIEIFLKYESNDESLLTELTDQWVNSNHGKKMELRFHVQRIYQ